MAHRDVNSAHSIYPDLRATRDVLSQNTVAVRRLVETLRDRDLYLRGHGSTLRDQDATCLAAYETMRRRGRAEWKYGYVYSIECTAQYGKN